MYTAARLLEILSRHADPSALLNAHRPTTPRPGSMCRCRRAVTSTRSWRNWWRRPTAGAEIGTIDGLRGDYPDSFGLIRASNTTPVLVLRFEDTRSAAGASSIDFMAALRRYEAEVQAAALMRPAPPKNCR